jgi:hypothetical protein
MVRTVQTPNFVAPEMVKPPAPAQKPAKLLRPEDREAVAAYISELCSDLASLARDNGLSTLSYILDMARLEADGAKAGESQAGRSPS